MISGIVPRPIAFVSSLSEDGVANLAPFRYNFPTYPLLSGMSLTFVHAYSWFNQVTHSPPLISVSISSQPDGGLKDTAHNIKATKQFTVNIISEPFIENANITSLNSPANVSEWEISGLTKEPSVSHGFLHDVERCSVNNTSSIDSRQSPTGQRKRV